MNNLERFLAICNAEKPDYYPVFGFHDAPGVSAGVMETTYNRLLSTGMPDIGGNWTYGKVINLDGWYKYWGTSSPMYIDFFAGEYGGWPSCQSHEDPENDEYIILEFETGAKIRQLKVNDITYSMPEFITYHVRDRQSWEYYKSHFAPKNPWTKEQIDEACKKFDNRKDPICVRMEASWGAMRELMGPEEASTILYDDPQLAHDIIDYFAWINRTFYFPVIERLKPEIVMMSEDICYNHGMFISPDMFREFCMPMYKEAAAVCDKAGVVMKTMDSDGNVMKLIPLLVEAGFNCLFPWEVKSLNDMFEIREKFPEFIMMGGLEKEVLNEGNDSLIYDEIMNKVPKLLEKGRYFPNGDHGIQPLVTYPNLCKFMTLLHKVCNNPLGEYPKTEL